MAPMESVASVGVGSLVDALAGDAPTPGGGTASGCAAALAAALAGMAGRYALRQIPDSVPFQGLVERADVLRERALTLADRDAAAYGGYVEASALPREPDPRRRADAVRAALDAAADVPLDLAALAAEVAGISERLAVSGNPHLRSDACTAVLLAAAVARSAAILVGENLRARAGDPRVSRAGSYAGEAAAAARRVLALFGHAQERAAS